jgi:hypothetical protein
LLLACHSVPRVFQARSHRVDQVLDQLIAPPVPPSRPVACLLSVAPSPSLLPLGQVDELMGRVDTQQLLKVRS